MSAETTAPSVAVPPDGLVAGARFDAWAPAVPRYVLADVDGTLVGSSGQPTQAVANTVAAAVEAGLHVGLATGRMRLAVDGLWERLGMPGPHVLHNGAEVWADGRTLAAWPVPTDGVAAILDLAARQGLYVEVYVEGGYLVNVMDERARPHWDLLGHAPLGVIREADDAGGPVTKATFGVFDRARVAPLVATLREAGLQAGAAGSPVTPAITYVNANHPSVDKGRAVAVAAAHLGVPMTSVVAVGDADNDVPMLAVAGTAVAMGQAPDRVLAQAHLVAPTVDNDGLATVLWHCSGNLDQSKPAAGQ